MNETLQAARDLIAVQITRRLLAADFVHAWTDRKELSYA